MIFNFWEIIELFLQILQKIAICYQKFQFVTENFDLLPKISICYEKFRFFTKISIFYRNFESYVNAVENVEFNFGKLLKLF